MAGAGGAVLVLIVAQDVFVTVLFPASGRGITRTSPNDLAPMRAPHERPTARPPHHATIHHKEHIMTDLPAGTSKRRPAAAPASDPEDHVSQPSSSPDGLIRTATAPFAAAAAVVPAGPVPVALGAGALAVAGVIEWPIAAAIGLGYLALRRWR